MQPDSNDIVYDAHILHALSSATGVGRVFGELQLFFASLGALLLGIWQAYVALAFLLSVLLLFGLVRALVLKKRYTNELMARVYDAERAYAESRRQPAQAHRFEDLAAHLASENQNDWKLAILEADVLLAEALAARGYQGASLGETLKRLPPHALQTLDDAWEAHKVRNEIAHGDRAYELTARTARETMNRYRRVFQELGVLR